MIADLQPPFPPPPQMVPSWRVTIRDTNMFSSGGLFNYSAFSLQITHEHSGLGEQREWCTESDDGIRLIPAVLLELDLSWANFQEEDFAYSSVTMPLVLRADKMLYEQASFYGLR